MFSFFIVSVWIYCMNVLSKIFKEDSYFDYEYNKSKYLNNTLLKFEGNKMETGRRLNIIKEINYESAIPRIIEDIKREMHSQLRDFQYLAEDGMFKTIPEYPEFPLLCSIFYTLCQTRQQSCHLRINLFSF